MSKIAASIALSISLNSSVTHVEAQENLQGGKCPGRVTKYLSNGRSAVSDGRSSDGRPKKKSAENKSAQNFSAETCSAEKYSAETFVAEKQKKTKKLTQRIGWVVIRTS